MTRDSGLAEIISGFVFITVVLSAILIFAHLKAERQLETRLYIMENLIDSKPKMDSKELEAKVNEIYNIVVGN